MSSIGTERACPCSRVQSTDNRRMVGGRVSRTARTPRCTWTTQRGTLFFYVLVEVSLSLRSRLSSIASACMTVSLALLRRCCSSRTAFNSELMRRFCVETVSTFFRASVSARRIACRSTSARCHSRFTALKRDCKSAYLCSRRALVSESDQGPCAAATHHWGNVNAHSKGHSADLQRLYVDLILLVCLQVLIQLAHVDFSRVDEALAVITLSRAAYRCQHTAEEEQQY